MTPLTLEEEHVEPAWPTGDYEEEELGWRYVEEVGANGEIVQRRQTLNVEDLLHPWEDDFIVVDPAHVKMMLYLEAVMCHLLEGRPGALVTTDRRLDFQHPGIEPLGPDNAVFLNAPSAEQDPSATLRVRSVNAEPALVIEITSPKSWHYDLGEKMELYELFRVPQYVVIDRKRGLKILSHRLTDTGYELIPNDAKGRAKLDVVGALLGPGEEGSGISLFDSVTGQAIPNYRNQALGREEAERQVAEKTEQLRKSEEERERSEERCEALERQREQDSRDRQRIEVAKIDAEQRLAESERRNAELLAELERLRAAQPRNASDDR